MRLATLALLALAPSLPAQTVTRVSVASDGTEANGPTTAVTVSESGRWVAMQSSATNLVVGDTNGADDIFLHDRNWATTTRISVGPGGVEANGASALPTISGDGTRIAFESTATNLVTGYGPVQQIYVHDVTTGVTTAASAVAGSGKSSNASISLDGQWVAFQSDASNLVAGDANGFTDIFLAEVATGATTRVSVDSAGIEANGSSTKPSISADGRWVTFVSSATSLVPGDTNSVDDVFLHDTQTGATTRISTDSAGAEANGQSLAGAISPDGGYVAFACDASNLVPGDTNGVRDIFVKVLASGLVVRVSVSSGGVEANGNSFTPGISWNGSEVTFHSLASNLVPGADNNGGRDVYKHDLDTGVTTLISADPSGMAASGTSWLADLDTGGRVAAFQSDAPDLVAGDTNGVSDAFVQLNKATWYIDVAGTAPGSGTPGDPYTSIQYAIDRPETVGGDELLVAAGTYYENLDLLGKSVSVSSAVGPQFTIIQGGALTALTATGGEGPGSLIEGLTLMIDSDAGWNQNVVLCQDGELLIVGCRMTTEPSANSAVTGPGVVVVRSTFTLDSSTISDIPSNSDGGGLYSDSSTLAIIDSTIERCEASRGNGAFLLESTAVLDRTVIQDAGYYPYSYFGSGTAIYASGAPSQLVIRDSSVLRNGPDSPFSSAGGQGAIWVDDTVLDIEDSHIDHNYLDGLGGAITAFDSVVDVSGSSFDDNTGADGGAFFIQGGGLQISGSVLTGNRAIWGGGGAIAVWGADSIVIEDTLIANSFTGNDEYLGGGAQIGADIVRITGCDFVENSAGQGGGASIGGLSVLVENSAFVRNRVAAGIWIEPLGGGLHLTAGGDVRHTLFEDNYIGWYGMRGSAIYGSGLYEHCTVATTQPENATAVWGGFLRNCIVRTGGDELGGAAAAAFSNVEGGAPGTGNIDEDPLFWDAEGGDFHLQPGSPCIDAGDPNSPLDPDGTIADMGAFPFDPDYCPPVTNYCTAGTTGNGCNATISAAGTPSATASTGFNVSVGSVEGQKQGIIFWGRVSKAAPWGGGTSYLCVQAPVKRTGNQDSGGTAGACDGSFALDFNAWMQANQHKAPGVGEVIYMQAWFRDPPSPKTTSLSDGLRFVVCP